MRASHTTHNQTHFEHCIGVHGGHAVQRAKTARCAKQHKLLRKCVFAPTKTGGIAEVAQFITNTKMDTSTANAIHTIVAYGYRGLGTSTRSSVL